MKNNKLNRTYIEFFLNKPEIITDNITTNLYEVYKIINTNFNDLFLILNTKESEIENINNKQTNFFDKYIKKEKVKLITFCTDKKKNTQKITFTFTYKDTFNDTNYISFYKKANSNKIYYGGRINNFEKKTKDFFNKNLEYIYNTIKTMEYYYQNYNITFDWYGIDHKNKIQTIDYNIFKVNINLSEKNPIQIKFNNPEYNIELQKSSSTEEYHELLKRIPIKIDELIPFYKNMVISSLENTKVKQLKK